MLKQLPSQEYLKECFNYDYDSGKLYWKNRPLSHFKDEKGFKLFNSRFAGKEFGSIGTDGYRRGFFNGSKWRTHRVVWKLLRNEEPTIILHSDGNTADNRIEKLLNGDVQLNMKDQKLRISNTSGVMGVSQHTQSGKWIVE